jgi:hypothetical protein
MMMMARITNVPTPFQAKVVGQIEHWYDQVAEWMSSEAGRRAAACSRLTS